MNKRKLLVSSLVILGSAVSLSAFAGEKVVVIRHYNNNPGKVVVKRGCDNTGCHYTKTTVSHNNHGKKIINTVKCNNGHCVNISKKINHKDNGAVVTKKTVCDASGNNCYTTRTKKF
jgi:hypothetical protein